MTDEGTNADVDVDVDLNVDSFLSSSPPLTPPPLRLTIGQDHQAGRMSQVSGRPQPSTLASYHLYHPHGGVDVDDDGGNDQHLESDRKQHHPHPETKRHMY